MEPAKRLGSEGEAKAWIDSVVAVYAQRSGISLSSGGAGAGGAATGAGAGADTGAGGAGAGTGFSCGLQTHRSVVKFGAGT